METLPPEIIINNILELTFPKTSVLFLVSSYFHSLQEKYYEQLGCTDVGSKNFLHALININKMENYIFGEYIFQGFINHNFNIIKFANDKLTVCMDHYLELLAISIKETKSYYQYEFNKNIDMSFIKMQIIFLIKLGET